MIPTSLLIPGQRVKIIESEHTTNWTRIDIGRTGTIIEIHAFQNRQEHGPRIHLLIQYDTREHWDGKGRGPVIAHAHPSQIQLLQATA